MTNQGQVVLNLAPVTTRDGRLQRGKGGGGHNSLSPEVRRFFPHFGATRKAREGEGMEKMRNIRGMN